MRFFKSESDFRVVLAGLSGQAFVIEAATPSGPGGVVDAEIRELSDMTGDGHVEVELEIHHNVMQTLLDVEHLIVSAHGGVFQVISPARVPERARTKEATHISGRTASVKADAHGATLVSVDALLNASGYFQTCESTWRWEGTVFARTKRQCEPTRLRNEILYDAMAAERGRTSDAVKLYERVVSDTKLQDGGAGDARRMRSIAAFRLLVLSLQDRQVGKAERWRQWLHGGSGWNELAKVADNVIVEWRAQSIAEGAARRACDEAARKYGQELDFSWAADDRARFAPVLNVDTLCPTAQP